MIKQNKTKTNKQPQSQLLISFVNTNKSQIKNRKFELMSRTRFTWIWYTLEEGIMKRVLCYCHE